jgi:hypothetical protein
MRAWSASHPLHAEVYERTRNEMEDRSSGRMRTLVTRISKGRILLDLFTGGCHRRQGSFTSLRGKLFEGFVYFVDFLGTGVHVFPSFIAGQPRIREQLGHRADARLIAYSMAQARWRGQ